jgi:histidyl-tRNA synthetase
MSNSLRTVRGTKDLLFAEAKKFDEIVEIARKVFSCYGYDSSYFPMFEFEEVFKRSLGDFSDVVSKEMYAFEDRGGEKLVLRPEFTAGIVRAIFSNSLTHELPLKLFTHGPLFRYERPQKGRQRQFNQLNIECFGIKSAKIDAEILFMAKQFLAELNLLEKTTLTINSLGCSDSRKRFQTSLSEYFSKYKNDLSEDSKIRLDKNPLRILDSKDETDQKICLTAPKLADFYTESSKLFWDELQEYLAIFNIDYKINPTLVRGLDYYCHTTFEFVTTELGAQGTVIGGGRYDGLANLMGGIDIPAIGFAAGIERLLLMYELTKESAPTFIMVPIGNKEVEIYTLQLAARLRANNIKIIEDYDMNSSKKMKRANKINAKYAIIIGEQEIKDNNITIKDLEDGNQTIIKESEIHQLLKKMS